MAASPHIIILGCGPAGAVAAIGLVRLGFKVSIISTLRKYNVVEGISDKVYHALKNAGLAHAVSTVSAPVPRYVHWNGEHNAANTERLVKRQLFDRAIITDLLKYNINVINTHITSLNSISNGWEVVTSKKGTFYANFIVEARGRAADPKIIPNLVAETSKSSIKKLGSLSFSKNWQLPPTNIAPFTSAISLDCGWLWLAYICNKPENSDDKTLFSQLTINKKTPLAKNKLAIVTYIKQTLSSLTPETQKFATLINDTDINDPPFARDSSSKRANELVADNYIRIGDAAMAVDPLSGNGIFQSVSSALSAPVVINTLINKPQNALLAKAFYEARISHLFERFCRMGRDFYQMELRWANEPFWQERAKWPDMIPAHNSNNDEVIEVSQRPVIAGQFIEQRAVLITKNQPLGIWQINGHNAVELYKNRRLNL